jgi:hypothetical protein
VFSIWGSAGRISGETSQTGASGLNGVMTDLPIREHGDLCALAGRAGGDFDEVGDADSAPSGPPLRLRPSSPKPLPIRMRQRSFHDLLVVTAVVGEAKWIGVGLGCRRNLIGLEVVPQGSRTEGGTVGSRAIEHSSRSGA